MLGDWGSSIIQHVAGVDDFEMAVASTSRLLKFAFFGTVSDFQSLLDGVCGVSFGSPTCRVFDGRVML
jgi:hypothetical protein